MHPEPTRISEADEADLAALADGRLDPAREQELIERLNAEPELAAAFEQQLRGLEAITAAAEQVSAPLSLQARIREMERAAATPRQRRRLPRLRIGLPALGLAATAAAAVIVVLLTSGGPSVQDVVAAAGRPPLATAALPQSVDGVEFPDYANRFGYTAASMRTDEIGDRATRTVTYTREGTRIAYTIVAGKRLPWPGDADVVTRGGTRLHAFAQDGRSVVAWLRDGHTCVLSSTSTPRATLLAMAAWKPVA